MVFLPCSSASIATTSKRITQLAYFELPLLVNVDRQAGPRKAVTGAIAYFDEYNGIPVSCDQVDLAKTATEVPGNRHQALAFQEFVSK